MAKKSLAKILLLIATGVWALLLVLAFTTMNPPQCPEYVPQEEIDPSQCIIGANIGLPIFLIFVMLPFAIVLVILWIIYLLKQKRANNPRVQP